jgi:hypothetical protein
VRFETDEVGDDVLLAEWRCEVGRAARDAVVSARATTG